MNKPWILRDEGVRAIFDHVRNIGIVYALGLLMLTAGLVASALT
jgi:hypothetical protein